LVVSGRGGGIDPPVPCRIEGFRDDPHSLRSSENRTFALSEEETMDKYVCTVCGYVYDPANGDPDNGVAAGTPFEKVPDSWVCPVCGASKDQFEKE